MEIKCLDPLGINGYERKANEVLSKHLPDSWKGYSSLEMVGRQGKDFEADIILITHDRIIVVELKNYQGKIFSQGKQWIQEYPDGRQEHRINAVSQSSRAAKILKSRLNEKLSGKFVPYVDSCVVLCGYADASHLPSDERQYVFTLDEFKSIGADSEYEKRFGKPFTFNRKEDIPNKNITIWDRIFLNNSADFKPKTFSSNNYFQNGTSFFQHKDFLYSEFQSQRADNANYKALMRRWDFTAPCIVEYARTPDQRVVIAQRESNVLGYIDNQDEDLKNVHLQLLHIPTDLTADFVELYEWPNKKERLDVFIRKNKSKLTKQNRLDLIQMLISQLARLHDIDVAHRDLGSHSIWLSLPSKVVLSNFLTAYYPDPDKKSVSNVRKIIQHGRVETPEELLEDDINGTAYTRDVYLATAACHYIAFDYWPNKDEGVYIWTQRENCEISTKLNDWFAKGLELDSQYRFQDLRAALSELNKLLQTGSEDPSRTLSALSRYHTNINVFADFGVLPVKSEGTFHLLKSPDNSFGVKTWFGVSDVNKTGGINHQLLTFFSRLELIKNSSLECLPEILEFGINPTMTNVYFKYEWIAGETWRDAVVDIDKERGIQLIKGLVEALINLHASRLHHGDLHPQNIIVKEQTIKFIDVIEYESEGSNKHTPAYVPASYETQSKSNIDRYAVIKIVNELSELVNTIHLTKYTNELLALPEIASTELEKLVDNLEQIVNPPLPISTESYDIHYKKFKELSDKLASDDGSYYLSIKLNAGKGRDLVSVQLSGIKQQLDILIQPEKMFIVGATLRDLRHDQFIWNKRDTQLKLNGIINLSNNLSGSNEKFIDFILTSEIYQELFRINNSAPISQSTERSILSLTKIAKSEVVDAREIWKVLVETELESYPKIQVVTEPKYSENKWLTFRYFLEDSRLDFDLRTECVTLKMEIRGELRDIGIIEDLSSDTVIVKPRGKIAPQLGDTLVVEGSMSAASLAKREKAISKIINNRAIIPNLPDYFSPRLEASYTEGHVPSDEELDTYTEYNEDGHITFSLNEQQRQAFKALYKYGPVALLQGPPGTGKTAFIGSYIHYSIMNGARRVLLVSQSHEAVNNSCEKVRSLFRRNAQPIDIVRLGDESNLSVSLTDVGEKALQEHYRDKFRAEYKERLGALLLQIGISTEMSNVITEFEVSFGQRFDQLSSQAKDKELAGSPTLKQKENKLKTGLTSFLEHHLQSTVSFEDTRIQYIRNTLLTKLSEHFEIYSENLIFKVRNLVEMSNEWLSVMASGQAQFQNFLAKTRTLVCGTCVGIGRFHYGIQENVYDLVVIDEAARSPASELAIAMQVGKKVLLVGDHKQLPPLFDENHLKAAKLKLPKLEIDELKRSDFERAFVSEYGKKVGRSLLTQYRMAPPIGNIVSENFYDGALATGRGETSEKYKELINTFATTVTWFDTSRAGRKNLESRPKGNGVNDKSYINDYEANTIISIIKRLYDNDSRDEILIEGEDPKIGVICMYGEQVRSLVRKINSLSWSRSLLEKRIIKVDTVDSYQGKENDIIILSLVRSNSHGSQGHVASENRANVSLSRAKECLFIVGNSHMWSRSNQTTAFGRVLKFIKDNESRDYSICELDEKE
ncbi:AAA domain-containing protein [Photorhabdus sp. APURE]|uniref:AAA domain-containing protein n=1 Tax=Photorhabdus aballayi TaxID=2991723 RepID=UPI00223DBBAD|nr:AAA domain-containing protein [Photorhabdus aballayi]MCW7550400.1 AAA domain-containing protein [Photorhabdus aballayi]